jgi:biotin operon repressor
MKELTKKQQAVATLLDQMSPREVAEVLNVSIQAVHDHIAAIRRKGYPVRVGPRSGAKESA